jgi:sarcosine oxidase / L-pipecolate oxidase
VTGDSVGGMRVLVIGRGVFGLGTALALAQRGQQVVVVGPRDPDASSEDTSRIIRNDYGQDEFHRSWAEEAIAGWQRWNVQASSALFRAVGLANLTLDAMSEESFAGASFRSLGADRRFDPVAISDLLPFLTPGRFVDGYLNPSAGWADASAAVRFLEGLCEDAGVGIVPERVAAIGDGWVGLADDGLLRADRIVVAAGAWTPTLVPETADVLLPSGQPVLYLYPPDPDPFRDVPVWALDVETTGFYGFPATPHGLVKVGHHGPGVTRRTGVTRVPDWAVAEFRAFFRQAVPGLAGARIARSRVCFYCDAPDGRFLIDTVPGRDRLVVVTGGSGHGFKFAPVIGDVAACVVLGVDHPRRSPLAWRAAGTLGDAARAASLGGAR